MDRNELEMLSQLLEEDDFAKGIAMGLSSERAAALARLRAMQPWQNERYSNSDIGNGFGKAGTGNVGGCGGAAERKPPFSGGSEKAIPAKGFRLCPHRQYAL